eukprot:TRINITY_DN3513_c0_g3_i1.p1 TRINITY_DN3513_c0_g3~~TRINITY_DN3513_c0_g3_i1.p1  ORF type:complete len:858 (-),score=204.71 TRINITY_DN3513_c0_g3_i1:16-2589(-)
MEAQRRKTRLCKDFLAGGHQACPHYAQKGWCSFAHGEHELAGYVAPQKPAPLPVAGKGCFDGQKREKTRLCKQWQDSGGDDLACPHFAKFGSCSYAHGEWELSGGQMAGHHPQRGQPTPAPHKGAPAWLSAAGKGGAWTPSKRLAEMQGIDPSPLKAPRHEAPQHAGSSKMDASRFKTRLCNDFVKTGRDDSCPFFVKNGWCAYSHGDEAPVVEQHPPAEEQSLLHAEKLKTKMCKDFVNSGGDDMACPHFAKHGWCAYAHGEHELEEFAAIAAQAAHAAGPALGPAEASTKIDPGRVKTRLCQSWVEGGRRHDACAFFRDKGWCAFAHGEHELDVAAQAHAGQQAFAQAAHTAAAPAEASPKIDPGRVKTRLCQKWEEGGRRHKACPFFRDHGWCAFAHGEHELDAAAQGHHAAAVAAEQAFAAEAAYAAAAAVEASPKIDRGRVKTRLCQSWVEGGRRDDACSFFRDKGWCAFAHGEHELEEAAAPLQPPAQEQVLVEVEISQKIDARKVKSRLCQQFVEGAGDDYACLFFAKFGWCAFAHGEHELGQVQSQTPAEHWLPQEASAKLNTRKVKSRLCQAFVDGGDDACPFFAQKGWCAFAHGEHELEAAAPPAQHASPVLPARVTVLEPEEPSARLDAKKIKSRLCQAFMKAGDDYDCVFFAQHGWCAFAHGEHEIGLAAGSSPAVSSTAPWEARHPARAAPADAPWNAKFPPRAGKGGGYDAFPMAGAKGGGVHGGPSKAHARADAAPSGNARMKTRLCKDFLEAGGDDMACSHFAQKGWCAYAHGEHELNGGGHGFAPAGDRVGAKLNTAKLKSRLCSSYVEGGNDDEACPHFRQHGWCAYAHGDAEIGMMLD